MCYAVLDRISSAYPPVMGRLHTCYSPVRRSPTNCIATTLAAPRLACVKPVASVHPEPGSNSSLLLSCLFIFLFENSDNFLLLYQNKTPEVLSDSADFIV